MQYIKAGNLVLLTVTSMFAQPQVDDEQRELVSAIYDIETSRFANEFSLEAADQARLAKLPDPIETRIATAISDSGLSANNSAGRYFLPREVLNELFSHYQEFVTEDELKEYAEGRLRLSEFIEELAIATVVHELNSWFLFDDRQIIATRKFIADRDRMKLFVLANELSFQRDNINRIVDQLKLGANSEFKEPLYSSQLDVLRIVSSSAEISQNVPLNIAVMDNQIAMMKRSLKLSEEQVERLTLLAKGAIHELSDASTGKSSDDTTISSLPDRLCNTNRWRAFYESGLSKKQVQLVRKRRKQRSVQASMLFQQILVVQLDMNLNLPYSSMTTLIKHLQQEALKEPEQSPSLQSIIRPFLKMTNDDVNRIISARCRKEFLAMQRLIRTQFGG